MSSPDLTTIAAVLDNGPNRSQVGGKLLTLAVAGQYIASTTLKSKPLLVWELEKTYYARYYVPVDSLHPDIKKHIASSESSNGASGNVQSLLKVSVSVRLLDTIKAKDGDAKALVEKVSIGSRSLTWVRFVGGKLDDFIRYEQAEIDDWFENGAIVASIKNPYKRIDTTTISSHIQVKVDGEVVAETNAAVLLNETGLKEAYYLPATSIKDWGSVSKTDLRTVCPYKGEAAYFSLTVGGKKYDNLVWYYPYPTHESAAVGGLISFYNKENVDIVVDGVKV